LGRSRGCGPHALQRLAPHRDLTEEVQGIRLMAPFRMCPGERQRTFGKVFASSRWPASSCASPRLFGLTQESLLAVAGYHIFNGDGTGTDIVTSTHAPALDRP